MVSWPRYTFLASLMQYIVKIFGGSRRCQNRQSIRKNSTAERIGLYPMQAIIVFCGQYLYLLVLAVALLVMVRSEPHERRHLLLVGMIAGVLAVVLTKVGGLLVNDPRPFVVAHTLPLIPHGTDNGFPSDHTVLCMTVASVFVLRKKWLGGVLMLCALLVGMSRVLAGLHHPLDILGGVGIALVAVAFGHFSAPHVQRFLMKRGYPRADRNFTI